MSLCSCFDAATWSSSGRCARAEKSPHSRPVTSPSGPPPVTQRDWLARGPFTLALSAGFFGFFAHTGVLQALERAGLRPQRVTGVSAGALAGGLWAGGLAADELAEELLRLRRADFWDPGLPLGGVLRGEKFSRKLQELLGAVGTRDFGDCAVPFAAVVFDVLRRETVVLERGPLAPAIQASCTVPLMFRPRLHARRVLVDGGVRDRNGERALVSDARVLLHALPTTSPLRHVRKAKADAPQGGPGRAVLQIPALPRVSPFRLEHGPPALERAREWTTRWLESPRA
ncbi:MAG: patatin-like phospholipase family protein [Myxococcales bacterium]|nr:patatin-like phospholipase family protein [Myxococcales bacterium]